ncbi:hypothetical protein PZE06_05460 [Robertmurraya sp. DFI.2.37]|uniref:portal protein n=1 Tax=Robertmurraya sp. DFI.2.37 TaxID=3031819 RepID=UPI00124542DB|nr:hypothetical protein [Robertmurraya sp. DFI.2.37]MDF1507628.1 hypothetical protein [Robertmurraya sp. DFI.2.37]
MSERTKDWDLYEAGKNYNNRLEPNYYDTVDANLAFFQGDQWRNLKTDKMPKPVFNIIKRIITFQVASLTSSKIKIMFEPLLYSEQPVKPPEQNIDPMMGGMQQPIDPLSQVKPSEIANAQVQNLFEKFKMDFKIKEALFDAAITADACAHFYFDVSKQPYGTMHEAKGEICMELVDGTNVFFGNANNPRVDAQPYIIISGRDMVDNLKEEAKRYKQKEQDLKNITEDYNYEYQSGDSGKIEVEADDYGKALYIIVYRKKKVKRKKLDEFGEPMLDEEGREITEEVETITATKSVENAYIYKDIDTGLSHYPVAWMNWEKQKNQYHGRALCTGILPNQIFINRMFAMVMYHLMMTAFPKAVYNADIIETWNNEIGAAIPLHGMDPTSNIKNIAGYLEPGNMSNQIVQAIELAMAYTKETLGVSDAALGQIDPKNTSAIIAVQKSSAIPLENPKSNLYEWIEDIGKILFDMMGTYYGQRPISMEINGEKRVVEFDFSQFKNMWYDVRADVGESSYWSEIASIQTLDNLLNNGHLDIINYLERVPVEYIPQKEELIADIREKMQMAEQQANDPANLIAQLPPEEQQAFMSAPPEIQQQILAQVQQPQAPMM